MPTSHVLAFIDDIARPGAPEPFRDSAAERTGAVRYGCKLVDVQAVLDYVRASRPDAPTLDESTLSDACYAVAPLDRVYGASPLEAAFTARIRAQAAGWTVIAAGALLPPPALPQAA